MFHLTVGQKKACCFEQQAFTYYIVIYNNSAVLLHELSHHQLLFIELIIFDSYQYCYPAVLSPVILTGSPKIQALPFPHKT